MTHVHQINVSKGGVPKLPVDSAWVSTKGLKGDRQAKPGIHGGIYKAVSLFSLAVIDELAAAGRPIKPGSTGENITVSGALWEKLTPGTILQIGDTVRLKITSYALPCPTIKSSFSDGNVLRMHHNNNRLYSRLYAQVLQEGNIAILAPIWLPAA